MLYSNWLCCTNLTSKKPMPHDCTILPVEFFYGHINGKSLIDSLFHPFQVLVGKFSRGTHKL